MTIESKIIKDVVEEINRAIDRHGKGYTFHERHSVLREEFEELWDEIKMKNHDVDRIYIEAKQTAAMAITIMMMAKEKKK